jgi:hypothetical protein
MKCAAEMPSGGVIHLPRFMETSSVIQYQGYYRSNLRGYCVGITDGRDI